MDRLEEIRIIIEHLKKEEAKLETEKSRKERSYNQEEVEDLLTTQRENCYVAILSETRNEEIATIALNAPEPVLKNK